MFEPLLPDRIVTIKKWDRQQQNNLDTLVSPQVSSDFRQVTAWTTSEGKQVVRGHEKVQELTEVSYNASI